MDNEFEYDWKPDPDVPDRDPSAINTGPEGVFKYHWDGPDDDVSLAKRPGTNYPDMPSAVTSVQLSKLKTFLNTEFGAAAEEGNLSGTITHYVKELEAAGALSKPLLWKLKDLADEAHRGRHSKISTNLTLAKLRDITKTFEVIRRRKEK